MGMEAIAGRMGAAFAVAMASCWLAGPWAIRRLVRGGWIQPVRYEDCPPLQPIQEAKRGTPTMGGLLVVAVGAAVAIVFTGLSQLEAHVVLAALIGMGALGLLDDMRKLKAPNARGLHCQSKLWIALGLGALIGWVLDDSALGHRVVQVPWLAQRIDLGWWWMPFSACVVAGSAHAVNLTDGMDGLAAGCLVLAFGALGAVMLATGSATATPSGSAIAIWAVSLAGACAGFLWFNSFPAAVFLGDVGALGLGAALGVLALVSGAAFGLVVIGGVFVAEALSVALQVASYRWRNKRRLFRVAPLHHHFHLGGIPEQKLVVRFWVVGMWFAALGVAALARS